MDFYPSINFCRAFFKGILLKIWFQLKWQPESSQTLGNETIWQELFLVHNPLQEFIHKHSVKDAIKLNFKFMFKFHIVIPYTNFILELLDLLLNNTRMQFKREHFQQVFWIIIGTSIWHPFEHIYVWQYWKRNWNLFSKITCPVIFKRFID